MSYFFGNYSSTCIQIVIPCYFVASFLLPEIILSIQNNVKLYIQFCIDQFKKKKKKDFKNLEKLRTYKYELCKEDPSQFLTYLDRKSHD